MIANFLAYSEIEADAWIGVVGLLAVILIVGCLLGLAQNVREKLGRRSKQ